MSKLCSATRKRKREQTGSSHNISMQAESESAALAGAYHSHTMDFGCRLNMYYWVDGEKFLTGKKHRRNAVGMTAVPHAPHVRHKHAEKQVNLQLPAILRRLGNPSLYKTLDARRVQNLLQYRTGRIGD